MPRTVVVTGSSTGIGRACALALDRAGFEVFAGVRKDKDAQALRADASSRLHTLLIDVADEGSIKQAASVVRDSTPRLWGLVNNAGVTYQGPLEHLPVQDLRDQFEVNVFGQIAVTQAFLPLIRNDRGRIVFMSSIGGRTRSLPLLAPYTSSKHALEALADSLRLELLPWGIHVSLVEPGAIKTPIWEKGDAALANLKTSLSQEARDRYEASLDRGQQIAAMSAKRGVSPEKVADRVVHALTSERPRRRYLVGPDAQVRGRIEGAIPDAIRDKLVARVMGYGKRH